MRGRKQSTGSVAVHRKLKANLAQKLQKAAASDLVDVVVQLHSQADPAGQAPAGVAAPKSRADAIAAKKAEFDRSVAGVEETVRKAGGEITGQAWINQTVRARVPAGGVNELCQNDRVAAVDAPAPLTPEAG